jgi:hypothetical protein
MIRTGARETGLLIAPLLGGVKNPLHLGQCVEFGGEVGVEQLQLLQGGGVLQLCLGILFLYRR